MTTTAVSSIALARAIALAALPGVKVSTTFTGGDRRRIRLTRGGGPREWALDMPRILAECYATTESGAPDGVQAEADALTLYDAFSASPTLGPWAGGWVTRWDGNTIADYPDPSQPTYARWQFTGDLYLLR